MVVLDTSALLFWTLAPDKLSTRAADAIDAAQQVVISSISIWEIGLQVKRAKLALPLSIEAYVTHLKEVDRMHIKPVSEATWLKNLALDWEHKDPADRTIVATARLLGCPLITSDLEIRSFYSEAIW
ncbi:MAG: type II toxin-antitoxin system VapC family toxin [Anaerolineae bacterium]|nr:type II toxin-antitoxin system VapC family toxin [Anaerolineae bacterium]